MEEWKDIKGYEGLYQVSNYGRVYSVPRNGTKGGIRTLTDMNGYLRLPLKKHGKEFNAGVHRLVAEAFIPNPSNKPSVNHIDGNKHNNHVNNLEWATWEEQIDHSLKMGLRKHQCNVQRKCILCDGDNILEFKTCKDLSEYLGFDKRWLYANIRKHGTTFTYNNYTITVFERGSGNDV